LGVLASLGPPTRLALNTTTTTTTPAIFSNPACSCTSRALVSSHARCARSVAPRAYLRPTTPRPAASRALSPGPTPPVLPAGQPPSCASVGDTIPSLVKPHHCTSLRQRGQLIASQWLKPRCHGTALHSRNLALAHRCTSADINQTPGPLSFFPTQSFPFPCETWTRPLQRPPQRAHDQCPYKHIQLAVEDPCRTTGKNPSTPSPISHSILQEHQSPPESLRHHIRPMLWRRRQCRPRSRPMGTSGEEASSLAAISGLEVPH
jgi:hypothetical protein